MLLYDNHARLRLLLQFYGSIYRRVYVAAIFFGFYSIALLMLKRHLHEDIIPSMENPIAAQSLGTLIAFTVTFRTTIAWSRYWESCREVMFMYSKWCDAYSQLMGFITSTEKIKEDCDLRRLEHFRMEITHFFSLLSAVAAERLMRGDIRRMEMRRGKGVPWNQQVVRRESLRTTDLTGSKNLFPMRILVMKSSWVDDLESGEETGVFEATRGSARSTLSAPPHQADAEGDVTWMVNTPHSALRHLGVSVTVDDTWERSISVVGEVSAEELRRLKASQDRVRLSLLWVNELVSNLAHHLVVAPPIVSRVFLEIANGALGCTQAEKLSDIPFPFIFAQLMAVAMIFIAVVWPICFVLITGDTWLTPFLSTGVVTCFWTLNEMAKELENPFGKEANNVPLLDAHERFIEFLTEMHGICLPRDRDYKSPAPIPPDPLPPVSELPEPKSPSPIPPEPKAPASELPEPKSPPPTLPDDYELEAEPEREPELEPLVEPSSAIGTADGSAHVSGDSAEELSPISTVEDSQTQPTTEAVDKPDETLQGGAADLCQDEGENVEEPSPKDVDDSCVKPMQGGAADLCRGEGENVEEPSPNDVDDSGVQPMQGGTADLCRGEGENVEETSPKDVDDSFVQPVQGGTADLCRGEGEHVEETSPNDVDDSCVQPMQGGTADLCRGEGENVEEPSPKVVDDSCVQPMQGGAADLCRGAGENVEETSPKDVDDSCVQPVQGGTVDLCRGEGENVEEPSPKAVDDSCVQPMQGGTADLCRGEGENVQETSPKDVDDSCVQPVQGGTADLCRGEGEDVEEPSPKDVDESCVQPRPKSLDDAEEVW